MKKIAFLIFLFIFFDSFFVFSNNKRQVISVLYFNNSTKMSEWDWFSRGISDMLLTDLSMSDGITVLEREDMQKIFEEQNFSNSDEVDDDQAIELGKMLSANKLITGSFAIQKNNIRIDAKIMDTETGVVSGVKTSGSAKNVFALEEELAKELLTILLTKTPENINYYKESGSIDAVKAYYQGEMLLEEGQVDLALKKFELSSKEDPLYLKPQKGITDAYKFLKDFRNFKYQRDLEALYLRLDKLQKRLREKPFKTYADLVKNTDFANMSQQEREKFNKENDVYALAQTPAQCYWHIQHTLYDIYDKKEEFLDDRYDRKSDELDEQGKDAESDQLDIEHEKEMEQFYKDNKKLIQEIVNVAGVAKNNIKNDSFIQEILYMELLALEQLHEYAKLKPAAEEFMMNYPDYRLVEFVMEWYEDALKELGVEK